MKALVITADGGMRCLEVKDPVPLVLKVRVADELEDWRKFLGIPTPTYRPGDYALCTLLAPTDEKMTVAVYEEDGVERL